MRLLRVDRSPVRLFLFGLVGLFLMLGAVDVMWGHWVATPPDTFNEEITSKGRNQRRADYVWGVFLLAGGAAVFGFAVTALIRRSPALLVQDNGLAVAMGAPGDDQVFIPWSNISFVSSGAQKNPNGGYDRDVLVVDVVDPAGLPAEPWGASWDGNRLVVDAGGWDKPIGEVVIHAGIALDRYQHFEGPQQVAIGSGEASPGAGPPPPIDPEEIKDD
jgi:hypothetical protein